MKIRDHAAYRLGLVVLAGLFWLSISMTSMWPSAAAADDWARCGREGGNCPVPERGHYLVRYGANGKFFFVETDGGMAVDCNNGVFGDPAHGDDKVCDYISQPPLAGPWVYCGKEDETCNLKDRAPHQVRYGDGNRWVIRIAAERFHCGNDMFGDIAPGAAKRCEYLPNAYTDLPTPVTFKNLCSEEQDCVLQGGLDPVLLRFGTGATWDYRLGVLEKFACNNEMMGHDPARGQHKFCQYSLLQPTVSAVSGYWEAVVPHCPGCTKLTKTVSASVTGARANQTSNMWSVTVGFKYSQKFGVPGNEESTETSVSHTYARTESITDSLSRTQSDQVGVECPGGDNPSMWQWKVDVSDLCWAQGGSCRTQVTTLNILCVNNPPGPNYRPRCAPGTFTDRFALVCETK